MALTTYSGTLGIKRAAHLLRRATLGGMKSQIDDFSGLTAIEAVSRLFPDTVIEPPLPLDPINGIEWVTNGPLNNGSEESELQGYFKGWFIGQLMGTDILQNESLPYVAREKLVFFMHTHFTTKESVVNNSRSLYFQNKLFRMYSFDRVQPAEINFNSLTKKLCIDNAMLKFLDGRLNVKDNPNENFARELMELYTIGRGLEGTLPETSEQGDYINYTEQDVQAAARILSGFETDTDFITIDLETGIPRGRARGGVLATQHDMGNKQFSDRLDNASIAPDPLLLADLNVTNEDVAIDEISQLIDLLYSKNETARHICRKIYRFYVYHDISTEIDDNIIANLADTFVNSGYKVQTVIEDLLKSQHFYDAAAGLDDNNFGGIIKSPMDLMLGAYRFFNITFPNYSADTTQFYVITSNVLRGMDDQGLNFYEPFEVAGYSAYHQFPIYNRNWISTNYLIRRYNFIRELIDEMEPGMLSVDLVSFVQSNFPVNIAENAESLIIALATYLFPASDNLTFDDNDSGAEITNDRLRYFRYSFLYSPQIDADPLASWTYRWNNSPNDEVVSNQLKNLINAMLQSPEYQLM